MNNNYLVIFLTYTHNFKTFATYNAVNKASIAKFHTNSKKNDKKLLKKTYHKLTCEENLR